MWYHSWQSLSLHLLNSTLCVQVSADNMYNPLTGVPNMYWFNVGVMDAKNIHFPTVNALQLGRAAPRNEVPVFMKLSSFM